MEGMKAEFPGAKITYVAGTQFLSQQGDPVPASALTAPDGKTGLKVEYSSRPGFEAKPTPLVSRVEPSVKLTEASLPEEAKGATKSLSVQWTGFLHASATGERTRTSDPVRLSRHRSCR